MAQLTLNGLTDGLLGSLAKVTTMFTELYNKQFVYKLVFYSILQPTPIYHTSNETLSVILDTAIVGVDYSPNNGISWVPYSTPISFSSGTESLWRVSSFNTGFTTGCLTLIIS